MSSSYDLSDVHNNPFERQKPYACCEKNKKQCENLGNGFCDEELNTEECAWDYGDCEYCSPGCFISMLDDGKCDSQCYNLLCSYDIKDCQDSFVDKEIDSFDKGNIKNFDFGLSTQIQGKVSINEISQQISSLSVQFQGDFTINSYTIINPDNFCISSLPSSTLTFSSIKIKKSSNISFDKIYLNLIDQNFTNIQQEDDFLYIKLSATQVNTSIPASFCLQNNLSTTIESGVLVSKNQNHANQVYQRSDDEFKFCDDGKMYIGGTCHECPIDTYSFNFTSPQLCFDCIESMNCTNNKIYPAKGYWRHKELIQVFRKCPSGEISCIGSNEDGFTLCGEGYKGEYCDECENGYGSLGVHMCQKCPDKISNAFMIIIIILFIGTVIVIMIKTTISTALEPSELYSICIKIGVNYFQIIYLCFQYKLKWPEGLSYFNDNKSGKGTDPGSSNISLYVSIKCLFDENMSDQEVYYGKVGLMVGVPILLFSLSWICLQILKKTKKVYNIEHYVTVSYIVPFLLAYPYIITYSLSPLACSSPEEGIPIKYYENVTDYYDYKYLIEMQSIKCDWDSHYIKIIWVTFFGIFVWGFGMPIFIFFQLYKYRKNLFEEEAKYKYGFLFSGYLHNRYYWEFIIFFKKILIVFLTVFMESKYNTNLQSVLLITFLIISFILQIYFKPYINEELNKLEVFASIAALATVLIGITYTELNIGKVISCILLIGILVVNLIFLFYWSKFMLKEFISYMISSFEFLKNRFQKGDGLDEIITIEVEKFSCVYMKEHQKLYTQIEDDEETVDNYLGKSASMKKLYRAIVHTEYEDYQNNMQPVFRELIRRKSTIT
ncbi:hypothetical protein SteCoe_29587 [Stentor coeruleus]|uniref:LNR domain-containing protein n=1 Tax=Stentor coeruleus TaxID=5963 RepID=A0A1R2B5V8_9CILI|nr:hypothetical protein SteCoe_29587 [Stentor coeruleus]